jgi:3-oxoacid CoA-transferase
VVGGFGLCGIPENLIKATAKWGTKELTLISNECGSNEYGLSLLLKNHQVARVHASYIGVNSVFEQQYLNGELELHLTPQGNLAEKLRAGGAGIPAFFSPTGAGTLLETGKIPIRYCNKGQTVVAYSNPREVREFRGKRYLLEESLSGDFAFVKCWKADKDGNLVFHRTARNFNPDVATSAKICIAEADHIVEVGELDPDEIHCPGIYVDRVFKGVKEEKRIEKLTLNTGGGVKIVAKSEEEARKRIMIAKRAAGEIKPNMYVNLGIGMPTATANFVDPAYNVYFHSENGLLGTGKYPEPGQEDPDLINAGKETVTVKEGGVILPSSQAFGIIRGGHLDMSILGGLQVGANGDLANWIIPGKLVKGMGGAMDLVSSVKRIVCVMSLTDKFGDKKFRPATDLPVTGPRCVSTLISDQAVFDFTPNGVVLKEVAKGYTVEKIRQLTDVDFRVADQLGFIEDNSSKYEGPQEEDIFA